jgi:hypothetical protein
MTTVKTPLIPSQEYLEPIREFETLLAQRTSDVPIADRFAYDYSPLWQMVEEGGWTEVGAGENPATLLELTEFARAWGRHLLPLPYIEQSLLARWNQKETSPVAAAPPERTVAVRRAGGGLTVPWPAAASPGAHDQVGIDLAPSFHVSQVDDGAPAEARVLELAEIQEYVACLAASATGAAEGAYARARDYSRMREQFGRPIWEFQVIQHRLADMWCSLELSRTGVVRATQLPEDAIQTASVVARMARDVCYYAIQIHGGMGYTWEMGVHNYLRHVMAIEWFVNEVTHAEEGAR